jgi:hypothetical protein
LKGSAYVGIILDNKGLYLVFLSRYDDLMLI